MPNQITALPRAAVTGWLDVVRLPVTAAARLTHHTDDETWGPVLAFDAFEAQVMNVASTVLRDETLRQDAATARKRVDRLRDAAVLEAEAEGRRVQADQQLEARRQAAEQQATQAEERAEQREERIEADEAAAKRNVRQQTEAQKQQAKKAEQATQKRIDDRERAAEQKRLQAERQALAERKKAVEAKGKTLELDKAARETKQKRQARS
jgi:colicin import membrane protein